MAYDDSKWVIKGVFDLRPLMAVAIIGIPILVIYNVWSWFT